MEIAVLPFSSLSPLDVYAVARLRQDVFVVEQSCVYPDLDGRDPEPATAHLLLRDGDDLLGYARVLDDGREMRIGRVALARSARGRGLADGLVRAAVDHCTRTAPDRDVVLAAQTPLAGWYGAFGFTPDGEEFLDDGIPHLPMRLARPPK